MLTVACVLKSGGIYDASWVARLQAGVARHLPLAHRFVCLSDVDVPCERIALAHVWPGWWSKIELFKLLGPVLFFDLDTAIVGDLSEIASAAMSGRFVILRDFYRGADTFGSGIMAWCADDAAFVYEKFAASPELFMMTCREGGDQRFLEFVFDRPKALRWQDAVPGQIVSYKVHCRGGIPAGARVVCLHGRPKFADMKWDDPVRLAWEGADREGESDRRAANCVYFNPDCTSCNAA